MKRDIVNVPAIKLTDVWVDYDGIPALEAIDFEIPQLDFLGIIGPNGGGKTTLLKSLIGLIRPARGKIAIFGSSPSKAYSLIGYVPQVSTFDRLYPINVWDVVMMGRLSTSKMFRPYNKDDREQTAEALERAGMFDYKSRQIGKLSGGQVQRILIARALAARPRILLLDEPTSSVDTEAEKGLYELLHELNAEQTIVIVSHDIGVISSHVKSIACLNRKLYHHGSKDLTPEVIEAVYGCPVDLIAHGTPHRVLKKHGYHRGKHD
jgi:zinc transport system ATP-binding protein